MDDYEKSILNIIKHERQKLDETVKKAVTSVTTGRKKLLEMDSLIKKLESKDI